jgi:hypothetical protein
MGEGAQTGRHVEGSAAIAISHRNGLTRIEPDPDAEGEIGLAVDLPPKLHLQFHGGSKRISRRAEDTKGFIAAELEKLPLLSGNRFLDDLREAPSYVRSGGVSVLVAEARVAPNVCNQERADTGAPLTARVLLSAAASSGTAERVYAPAAECIRVAGTFRQA